MADVPIVPGTARYARTVSFFQHAGRGSSPCLKAGGSAARNLLTAQTTHFLYTVFFRLRRLDIGV